MLNRVVSLFGHRGTRGRGGRPQQQRVARSGKPGAEVGQRQGHAPNRRALVGGHAGEGVYPLFQPILTQLVAEFEGRIERSPIAFTAGAQTAATVLSYPSKALPDAASDRLYIADAGQAGDILVQYARLGETRATVPWRCSRHIHDGAY